MNRRDPDPMDLQTTAAARELFEQASRRLDPATALRLREARRTALAGNGQRRPGLAWGMPAGAFAATVMAVGLAWWWPGNEGTVPTGNIAETPVSQAELDALLDEDPDFYAWLAEAPVAMNDGGRR